MKDILSDKLNNFSKTLSRLEEAWLDMLKDRNLSSHLYDEAEAQGSYKRIKETYFKIFKTLEDKLKEKLKTVE